MGVDFATGVSWNVLSAFAHVCTVCSTMALSRTDMTWGGGSNSSIRVVCSLQPIKDSCSGVGLVKVHHRAPPTHPTCCWHKALTTITITYCSRPCFFSGSTASGHYRGGPSREHSGFPPPQSGSLGKFIAVALNKLWD